MLHRALRLLRTYHQLKQIDLAKLLGISNSYLSELEKGIEQPSVEILEKYSNIFKIPKSSILLFSESLDIPTKGIKLRIAAADKILRMLEFFG